MKLQTLTIEELVKAEAQLSGDPANRQSGLYMLKPAVRKRVDAIQREITHRLAMKRAASGDPVPCAGYSGRQSNRR